MAERTMDHPLTPALSQGEREQDELPLGCLKEYKERPTGQKCLCFLVWRGSAIVSLSLGERAGVRGTFSSARTSVVQFQAGGLADGSRWWSEAEPPDADAGAAPDSKGASWTDAGRERSWSAMFCDGARLSCVPPGSANHHGSVFRFASGGFRSQSLASPPANVWQASGLLLRLGVSTREFEV